eukprot:TRINITY_DN510_c1_g1_i3.p1 TRINITY_DN510_c1_g1~~TRINITY_DN510_c1_g1_i3.p1  ORF type:complete len:289 (-),score=24.55 TRINITY_DN510_c1_g1_i3:172-1038(-)
MSNNTKKDEETGQLLENNEEVSCGRKVLNFFKAVLESLIPPPCPWELGHYIRLIFLIVLISLIVLAVVFNKEIGYFLGANGPLRTFVSDLGWVGPVAYGGIYALCTVLMIPGAILSLASGIIFPQLWVAFITISLGSTVGATIAFLLGRTVLRSWVTKKTEEYPLFKAVDAAIARKGLWMVMLLRLSPIFPFNVLNYALSLTGISFFGFFYGSWVGMAPGTFMFIYIPWASLHAIQSQGSANLIQQILTYGVGAVVTIGVVVAVTIIAKRAINKEMEKQKGENPINES